MVRGWLRDVDGQPGRGRLWRGLRLGGRAAFFRPPAQPSLPFNRISLPPSFPPSGCPRALSEGGDWDRRGVVKYI